MTKKRGARTKKVSIRKGKPLTFYLIPFAIDIILIVCLFLIFFIFLHNKFPPSFVSMDLLSGSENAINISGCGMLNVSGDTYLMNQNIIPSGSSACINITAQNITLDCNSFTLANSTFKKDGIFTNQNGTFIKNCNIQVYPINSIGGGLAIELNGVNNATIENTTANNNFIGIKIINVNNSFFDNINLNYNSGGGIFANGVNNNNTFSNINLENNTNLAIGATTGGIIQNTNLINITSYNTIVSNSATPCAFRFGGGVNNIIFNLNSSGFDTCGIQLDNNNSLYNSSFLYNQWGIQTSSGSNITISNIIIFGDDVGISLSSGLNSILSNIYGNENGLLINMSGIANIANLTSLNNKQAFNGSISNANNIIITDNLIPSILNFNAFDNISSRNFIIGSNITNNFNIFYLNGTPANNFSYNYSIYPSSISSSSVNSNNLSITFNATKEGIYTLSLNVIINDVNITEKRNLIFLIGNITYSNDIYYMFQNVPAHGQPKDFGQPLRADSGSYFDYIPDSQQIRQCGGVIQLQLDNLIRPYFEIVNESTGWYYNGSGVTTAGYEAYATWGSNYFDALNTIPNSTADIINSATDFTNMNIISDYLWRPFWIANKINSANIYVISNSTNPSYTNLSYGFTGPEITQFSADYGSDLINAQILSAIYNDSSNKNALFQFSGTGKYILAVNMPSGNYDIFFDDIECGTNSNCDVNSNSNGANVTINLSNLDNLDILYHIDVNTSTAPQVYNSPTYQIFLNNTNKTNLVNNSLINQNISESNESSNIPSNQTGYQINETLPEKANYQLYIIVVLIILILITTLLIILKINKSNKAKEIGYFETNI